MTVVFRMALLPIENGEEDSGHGCVCDIVFQAVLCGVSCEHLFLYQMPS